MSENNAPKEPSINFVPPKGPTPAELAIFAMEDAFKNLTPKQQEDLRTVRDRLDFMLVKFGLPAKLAIVHASLRISKEEGK